MRFVSIRTIVASAILASVIAAPVAKADAPATQTAATSSGPNWMEIFMLRPNGPRG